MAGEVGTGVGCQQEEGAVEFVGLSTAAHRRAGFDVVAARVGVEHLCAVHLGLEPGRGEGVDPDALARPLHGEFPGEVVQAALGGGIAGHPQPPSRHLSEHRAEVDDHPGVVVVDPPACGPAGQIVGGDQVDLEFVAEVVEVVVDRRDDSGDAGVVDQDVESAVVVDRGVDQVLWSVR